MHVTQGDYKPEYKLAEEWEYLLESAKSGNVSDLLRQHHTSQRTANGSFLGTLAPELTDQGYRYYPHLLQQ